MSAPSPAASLADRPALALALGVGVAAAADIDVEGTIGHREYTPLRADEIPDDGYELGIGKLDVDLRELDWAPSEVVELDVDLGIGQGNVLVPEDVCVDADVSAKSGSLVVAGEQQQGFDVGPRRRAPSEDRDPTASRSPAESRSASYA